MRKVSPELQGRGRAAVGGWPGRRGPWAGRVGWGEWVVVGVEGGE